MELFMFKILIFLSLNKASVNVLAHYSLIFFYMYVDIVIDGANNMTSDIYGLKY